MSQFAILCSGQGAQTPGLFDQFPFTAAACRLRDETVAAGALVPEVAAWLTAPDDRIFLNHFSQPLLALYQAMVWSDLAGRLPAPDLVAGYSLGELSAYFCAGALPIHEVVRLAGERARLMDAASGPGALWAVTGLRAASFSHPLASVAIVVGEDHFIVGCRAADAEAVGLALREAGASEVVRLPVTVASHTPLLETAVAPFRDTLAATSWSPLRIPVLVGINAAKVYRREQAVAWLPEQIHRTVRWDLILQRLVESHCQVVLEIGPGRQLAHMAVAAGLEARSAGEFRSLDGICSWVETSLRRFG
jgi:[acyl-carrier-protein] S-malonyltransferase